MSALPVAAEIDRGRRLHRQSNQAVSLLAIADAAQILAPGGLLGLADQVGPGDVMVVAEFGPAQAAEVGFRTVGAGASDAVALLMVDATHGKAGMQGVPGWTFIGVDRRSFGNTLASAPVYNQRDRRYSSVPCRETEGYWKRNPSARPRLPAVNGNSPDAVSG